MSALANQFLSAAKNAKVTDEAPRITYEGQNTFYKFCTVCHDEMPHVRRDDHSECVVCGLKTYKHEQGLIRLGFAQALSWLILVLIVLFVVLKDWPW